LFKAVQIRNVRICGNPSLIGLRRMAMLSNRQKWRKNFRLIMELKNPNQKLIGKIIIY
jgi:hypothetical protein